MHAQPTIPLMEPLSHIPAGIGLRFDHYDAVLEKKPNVGFLEIHSENAFGGGYHRDILLELSASYPISLHGVGLSLGASEPVCKEHVAELKRLVDEVKPILVSDHASWSRSGNAHLGDLLPLPYNTETLDALCSNIDRVQQALGREILIENPSTYLTFEASQMTEAEFMVAAALRTNCKILLDINNIYVQAYNHDYDPNEMIDEIPSELVQEMHLAGHIRETVDEDTQLLIDTHSQPVCDEVWQLYRRAIQKYGAKPTLIEWDKDIPALNVLLEQANLANHIMDTHNQQEADYAVA
ncbi:MAG: DUF692 domain-containing protein [Rickettsiales bacterium]|nr:DUF692 domain-containing protein [Rickettsiales bacterium]